MSNLKLCILLFCSAVVGTVLFWVALFFWFNEPVSVMVEGARAAFIDKPKDSLNYKDAVTLGRLVEKGIVIDSTTLLSQISGFYTTIITILITLLTILGISIPLYIKTNAEHIATRQTKMEVIRYCRENNGFYLALKEAIDLQKPSILDSLSSSLDVTDDLDSLAQKITKFEQVINLLEGFDPNEFQEMKDNIRNIESYVQALDPIVDTVVSSDRNGRIEGL